MKLETLLTLVLFLCRLSEETSQTLEVVKNGYRGIVVALPPDVTNPSERAYLVSNIKSLFEQASKELFRATNKRLYFESVSLLVPRSWENSNAVQDPHHRTLESYGDADVLVFTGRGIAGNSPYTIQHGGCSKNGHKIYLPQGFVNDEKRNDKGKAFLHEWSHYRFGVFEERGFPGDFRYPVFYKVPGTEEFAINDCSNKPLNYSLVNEENAACELQWHDNNNTLLENGCHLDEKSLVPNTEVTSSLMSMEFLSNVKEYCREDVHNILSPTKHNIMCDYKDVWKVIQSSQDVLNTPHSNPTPPSTTFYNVQEGQLRIAVLYTCNGQNQVNFETFTTALHHFIEDSLPDGARTSILGYHDGDGETGLSLTSQELRTKENRANLTKMIEHYKRGVTVPYVEPALGKLIKELQEKDVLEGTTVILVTNGTMKTDDILKVQKTIVQNNIRMHVIINADGNDISPGIDALAQVSGGKVFHILDLEEKQKELQLMHALDSSLEGYSSLPNSYTIAEYIINPDSEKRELVYRIPVDPGTEQLLVYLYRDRLLSIIDTQSVRLTATSDDPNHDRPSGTIGFTVANPEAGVHNLTLTVDESREKPMIILATSLFRRGENIIHVTSWINNHALKVTPRDERVVFYVNVQQGVNPVSGARVIATVYYPNATSIYEMELLDNGLGDPDVTANDGIYSRSFTAFGTNGYYSLSIRVDDNDGNARIITGFESTNENKICCGSFIPDLNREETGPFSRISKFGSFYVFGYVPSEDVYPPNRITDLRVTVLSQEKRNVRLTWTAPGSNYDSDDKASIYQIKYYRDMVELLKRRDEPCANDLNEELEADAFCVELNEFNFISKQQADRYGEEETRDVKLNGKYFLDDLYFVIYALDQVNNTSPMSNIAPAFLPKVLNPTIEPTGNSTGLPLTSAGGLNSAEIGMIVGIVLGSLVLIAIMVLALIWFHRRRKRKDSIDDARPQIAASQRVNSITQRPNTVANGNAISEVSSWSASTLMDHYDSMRDAKKQTISKPITSIQDVLNDTSSDYKVEKNDMYEPAYDQTQAENRPYNPTLTSQTFQNSTPKKTTQV